MIIVGTTGRQRGKILELVSCPHPSVEAASASPEGHLRSRGKETRRALALGCNDFLSHPEPEVTVATDDYPVHPRGLGEA